MSNESDKRKRQQLAEVVDLKISPARVRDLFDHHLVNKDKEKNDTSINAELHEIKMEGNPNSKPAAPASPSRNAKKGERDAYHEAREKYTKDFKEYNTYKSPRYEALELNHKYYRQLKKLSDLLLKSNRSTSVDYEIAAVKAVLSDKAPPQKEEESKEAYEKRISNFKPKGFSELHSKTLKMDSPDSIHAEMARVEREDPAIKHFLSKDQSAKDRVRFNDQTAVVVAAVMEAAVEQLAEHTVKATFESGKKTMLPDHCVSPGIERCSLFPLISNLSHYEAVCEKHMRRVKYDEKRRLAKAKDHQDALRKARKEGNKSTRPKFEFPTFAEDEVKAGFAVVGQRKKPVEDGKRQKKLYQWYGIDVERSAEDDDVWFGSYTHKVCKSILQAAKAADIRMQDIRIGSGLTKFFSDLIVDFVKRICPLTMSHIEAMGTKTIDEKVVMAVIKNLLLDSYRNKSVRMTLNDEHERLFADIKRKVNTCREHHTRRVEKKKMEARDEGETSSEEENGDDELNGDL